MNNRTKARKSADFDIIIVGAGVAGKTLSLLLPESCRIALIDRADQKTLAKAAQDVRTTALSYGSARIFGQIGVWDKFAAHSEPITDIRITDGASPLFLHFAAEEVSDDAMGYIIENHDMHRILLAEIEKRRNISLLAPAAIENMARGENGVEIALLNGGAISGKLLIGADGRRSKIREFAGIGDKSWKYGQTAVVASLFHENPHQGVAFESFLAAGPLALLPMRDFKGRHGSSLVWSESTERAADLLALSDAEFCALLQHRFGGGLGAFELRCARQAYPLDFIHADNYIADGIVLIADAAHGIHPIAGQGLNLGLRDVEGAAQTIAEIARLGLAFSDETMWREYEKSRRFDVTSMIAATDWLNRLFQVEASPIAPLRKLGIGITHKIPKLRRAFMRRAMGDF